MKVALVYDRLNKWGGAERVLLALHKLFPDAPLYTSVYDPIKASWAKVFDVRTSFLQKFPYAMHHELYAALMPLAFECFDFSEYDLVISVTSEAAKGIITKPQTKHICYCLTPTRYLWSGHDEYFRNLVLRIISKPAIWYLKFWDKIAAQRPDAYIAISKEVQRRISKYYNRESTVAYPPSIFGGPVKSNPSRQCSFAVRAVGNPSSFATPYFLIVSRLVPYKRVDLAIKTFNKLKLPLKIVGTGSEMKMLKAMSGPTIELVGYLTDKELVGYYSGCRALIFPGIEDFGLTILEAQSFGKPVVAFRGGGAEETIIEKKTGIFFDKQTVESLEIAIKRFDSLKIDPKACLEQAEKFDFGQFKEKFMKGILK
jgi:glycosyltransferase involved in cell wall biosynthesis